MRILWVNPSFLDYRVPVYQALDAMAGVELTVVFSRRRTPERVIRKIEAALGPRAVGLAGERRLVLGPKSEHFSNKTLKLPWQPGLWKAVMRTPADVVIAEGFGQWTPVAWWKSLRQHKPFLICYERTHHTERHCQGWRTGYRRLLIPRIDAMLCSGELCRQYSASLGMAPGRTTLGHMAADTDGLAAAAARVTPEAARALRERLGAEGLLFLYVGRLIELKGLAELLGGWRLFEERHPGAGTLLLVGEGNDRGRIEARLREHGLKNVRLAGEVDYDAIAPYYAAADVFVLPTLEDNWALVIPEAMACGLPVLGSIYTGNWPELVRAGENGWTFDPLAPASVLAGLERCLENRERLPRMGEASRAIVSRFTPRRAAQSVYEGCLMAIEHRQNRNAERGMRNAE